MLPSRAPHNGAYRLGMSAGGRGGALSRPNAGRGHAGAELARGGVDPVVRSRDFRALCLPPTAVRYAVTSAAIARLAV